MIRPITSIVSTVCAVAVIWGCASAPPLIKAAYDGNIDSVQVLLKEGLDVNMKGGRWRETALIAAAGQGHLEAVNFLLEKGADVNLLNSNGENALTGAAWGCYREVAMVLVAHGADVNVRNTAYGTTPFMLAVECGDPDLVKFLIAAGADVTVKNNAGVSPLMTAVWRNNAKMAEILIDAGVDVDTAPDGFGSPLYEAAANGYASVVSLLVEKGADVNFASDYLGWTPLMVAAAEGRFPVVSTLIKAGADINVKGQDGYTPLSIAAYSGNAAIAKILCESGAHVNAQNADGWTALQFASSYQYEDVVAVLLMYNATVDIRDKKGHDALWWAEKYRNSKIINMLKNPDPASVAALVPVLRPASNAVDGDRIDAATIELVRTAAPLKVSYSNIVFRPFEISERLKQDYSDAAVRCEQSIIDHLKHIKAYKNVTENATSPYADKTVLVDGFVEDIHYASTGSRIILGPLAGRPFMNVRIKLTDAGSKAVIHEKVISTNTNVWFAGVTMGTSDARLPLKMGEIIGEYLHTIIPAEPVSN